MSLHLDAPPSVVELVKDNVQADSVWKRWLNNLFVFLTVDDWREIGATDEPAFASGWVNMGGDHETAAFYKDPFGMVHCKGGIKSGTIGHNDVFIFPEGYRPSKDLHFPAIDFTQLPAAYLHVDYVTGALHVPAGDNRGIALNTIHFRV